MSLINDALKQARQSQQNNPPSGSTAVAAGRILLARRHELVSVGADCSASGRRGIFRRIITVKTHAAARRNVFSSGKLKSVSNALPVVTNAPSGNTVPAVPPPPPEPKLQGILFDPTRPCAIVDGNMVFVGGHVGGFRVAAISKSVVTLKNGTETKVLRLGR